MPPDTPYALLNCQVVGAGYFQHLFAIRRIHYGHVWFAAFVAHLRLVVPPLDVLASLFQHFLGTVSGVSDSIQAPPANPEAI